MSSNGGNGDSCQRRKMAAMASLARQRINPIMPLGTALWDSLTAVIPCLNRVYSAFKSFCVFGIFLWEIIIITSNIGASDRFKKG